MANQRQQGLIPVIQFWKCDGKFNGFTKMVISDQQMILGILDFKRQCCACLVHDDRTAGQRRCKRRARGSLLSKQQIWVEDQGRQLSVVRWATCNGRVMTDENTEKIRRDSEPEGWHPEFEADWCRAGFQMDREPVGGVGRSGRLVDTDAVDWVVIRLLDGES